MSDQATGNEGASDYTNYGVPPGEDRELLSAPSTQPLDRRDRAAEKVPIPGVPHTHDPLDEAVALANLLVAPLDPARALGEALLVGLRLLPDARKLTVYALEHDGTVSLLHLATAQLPSPTQPPTLDLAPHHARTLGLGVTADGVVLDEQRPLEVGGVTAIPVRAVGPEAHGVAGALVIHWNPLAQRLSPPQSQNSQRDTPQALALLTSCCAVLLERRAGDDARDAFLSLTVHELRSPLTAIKGYAQLLLRQARRLAVPPQMHQAIDAIEEQATRMADMISEMHDAVRIRRGDLELHPEAVDIVPLVAQAVQQQRRLFPEHDLTLEAPGEPLIAAVDPQRLAQVVAALVNNAARYSPGGGPVVVRISRCPATQEGSPEAALVSVQDHGIGIAASDRTRIFAYLYRAPEAKRRHLSGLGLGLFVGRALVEGMGGRLWLHDARHHAEQYTAGAANTPGGTTAAQPHSGSIFCFTAPLSGPD